MKWNRVQRRSHFTIDDAQRCLPFVARVTANLESERAFGRSIDVANVESKVHDSTGQLSLGSFLFGQWNDRTQRRTFYNIAFLLFRSIDSLTRCLFSPSLSPRRSDRVIVARVNLICFQVTFHRSRLMTKWRHRRSVISNFWSFSYLACSLMTEEVSLRLPMKRAINNWLGISSSNGWIIGTSRLSARKSNWTESSTCVPELWLSDLSWSDSIDRSQLSTISFIKEYVSTW